MKRLALLLAASSLFGAASASARSSIAGRQQLIDRPTAGARPEVLKLVRPAGGEWLGLYILGKKAGYAFSDVEEGKFGGARAVHSTSIVALRANVGGNDTQRLIKDERWYEAKDHGHLLGFRVKTDGDGASSLLDGKCNQEGCDVTVTREGMPPEKRHLPPSKEEVEEADAPRLVAQAKQNREAVALDLEETLADKKQTTEYVGESTLTVAGVTLPVVKVRTIEDKSKIPVEVTLAKDGRVVQIDFGQVMVGKAEPEKEAKRLDHVDLFALTRVVLDKPLPASIRLAPSSLTLVVKGLPKEFQKDTYRQRFEPDGGSVKLMVDAKLPTAERTLPISAGKDEELKDALKPTLAVDSDDPRILAMAKKVVGGEKDAFKAAWKLTQHVNGYLAKTYGASSDRATDVLTRKKGDCTEHALLLTALARASGIPARRVDGLVYMDNGDGVPALYWHEWTEVYVGEWVAMDATFGQKIADPTHIALGGEGSSDAAGLIGQLKMTVADVKAGEGTAPKK